MARAFCAAADDKRIDTNESDNEAKFPNEMYINKKYIK
jgi:hypothetical protein